MSVKAARGMSRGRRGMFLRIPEPLHQKLLRMVSHEIADGNAEANINGLVIRLIAEAPESRKASRTRKLTESRQ